MNYESNIQLKIMSFIKEKLEHEGLCTKYEWKQG